MRVFVLPIHMSKSSSWIGEILELLWNICSSWGFQKTFVSILLRTLLTAFPQHHDNHHYLPFRDLHFCKKTDEMTTTHHSTPKITFLHIIYWGMYPALSPQNCTVTHDLVLSKNETFIIQFTSFVMNSISASYFEL